MYKKVLQIYNVFVKYINCTDNNLKISYLNQIFSEYLLELDAIDSNFNFIIKNKSNKQKTTQCLYFLNRINYLISIDLYFATIAMNNNDYNKRDRCISLIDDVLQNMVQKKSKGVFNLTEGILKELLEMYKTLFIKNSYKYCYILGIDELISEFLINKEDDELDNLINDIYKKLKNKKNDILRVIYTIRSEDENSFIGKIEKLKDKNYIEDYKLDPILGTKFTLYYIVDPTTKIYRYVEDIFNTNIKENK